MNRNCVICGKPCIYPFLIRFITLSPEALINPDLQIAYCSNECMNSDNRITEFNYFKDALYG